MDNLIYFDNAATSFPKPDVTHDTARDFYRENGVNPGRTGCDMALRAEEMIHGTRNLLSDFFNPSLVRAGDPEGPQPSGVHPERHHEPEPHHQRDGGSR